MNTPLRFLLPLGAFLCLAAVFGLVLFQISQGRDIREVPSPLIGKPAPAFELPLLAEPGRTMSSERFKGRVSMVNVWASWCVSCRAEHGVLLTMATAGVPIIGINYKDERAAALDVLAATGNPYEANVFDPDGRAAIDWGVYGTPESFIVDRKGVIRYKRVGPISVERMREEIMPLIEALRES